MEKPNWLHNLQWAFLAGLTGVILAYLLTRFTFQLTGENHSAEIILYVSLIPAAAFIAGLFSWLLVCQWVKPLTIAKGALTGVFIGWIAHPLLGAVWMVYAQRFPNDAYRFVPDHWASVLLRSLLYSAWLTIPLGGIAGGLIAYLQMKSAARSMGIVPEEPSPTTLVP